MLNRVLLQGCVYGILHCVPLLIGAHTIEREKQSNELSPEYTHIANPHKIYFGSIEPNFCSCFTLVIASNH